MRSVDSVRCIQVGKIYKRQGGESDDGARKQIDVTKGKVAN